MIPIHALPQPSTKRKDRSRANIAASAFRLACLALLATALASLPAPRAAFARDAAFVTPGATSTATASATEGAVRVEPKNEIDLGETILNVARRTTLFFVNQSGAQIQIEKISLNNDGNVSAEITADDCSKQGTLAPTVRCSVEISVTPNTPGAWSVEALMTHNGSGRIARAKLTGKTTGSTSSEKKDSGLSLSAKDTKPVEFGAVEIGRGKIVRSALMVNDSPDPITLYSIDVIEADNGLQTLNQGCAVDMELKPGESCPVTLVWTPSNEGLISTDLIIRHSGRLGFAVIPIRGAAKGEKESASSGKGTGSARSGESGNSSAPLYPPLGARDVENALSAAISNGELGQAATLSSAAVKPTSGASLRLIGTIGHRAIILKPDNSTAVIEMGAKFDTGHGTATLMTVTAKSADISFDGKRLTLPLEPAPELIANAPSVNRDVEIGTSSDKRSSAASSRTPSSPSSGYGMSAGSVK